jgi:outer membrane murein-binding lipoprotein Lpp
MDDDTVILIAVVVLGVYMIDAANNASNDVSSISSTLENGVDALGSDVGWGLGAGLALLFLA